MNIKSLVVPVVSARSFAVVIDDNDGDKNITLVFS